MVSTLLTRKVELGPRQLTFGFDDLASSRRDRIFQCIETAYQSGSPALLEDLLVHETLQNNMSALDILQGVFRLAEDLKIHFVHQEEIHPPRQVKQTLLEAPDTPFALVTNRPVDDARFAQAREVAHAILPAIPEDGDQYGFSRQLVEALQSWQTHLAAYAPLAEQPFFPGEKEIHSGLNFLEKILEKRDSYTLILNCLKYQSRLVPLAKQVEVFQHFHQKQIRFWQMFVNDMDIFKAHLPDIEKDPEVMAAYRRLHEIMSAPAPFDQVDEARQLLPDVQVYYQEVEKEKLAALRADAASKIEKMITKLIGLFETFNCDETYRNECLQELRTLIRQIERSDEPDRINLLVDDARDFFVDTVEEM